MRNNNFTLIVVIILVIISCDNNIHKEYYEDGKIKKECKVFANKDSMYCIDYYKEGGIKVEQAYKNGKLEGIRKEYYESGTLKMYGTHSDSIKNGYYSSYYENGKMKQLGYYNNDTISGEVKIYDEEGKLYQRQFYLNFLGEVKDVGTITYDSIGAIIYETRRVEILPLVDTIDRNKDIAIFLELRFPRFDSTYFLIGNYNNRFVLEDSMSLDTVYALNQKATIYRKFQSSGMNFIRGFAVNCAFVSENKKSSTYKVQRVPYIYFEKRYYVK